jgi:hypothetical protein
MVHCTLYLEFQSSLFFFFTVYILLGTLSLSTCMYVYIHVCMYRLFVTLCTTCTQATHLPFVKKLYTCMYVYHLYFNFQNLKLTTETQH